MITDKESPTIGDIGKLALNNLSTSLEQAVRTNLLDKLLKQHGYRFNLPCGANMPTLEIIPHRLTRYTLSQNRHRILASWQFYRLVAKLNKLQQIDISCIKLQ